jgi:hypothetical protein
MKGQKENSVQSWHRLVVIDQPIRSRYQFQEESSGRSVSLS